MNPTKFLRNTAALLASAAACSLASAQSTPIDVVYGPLSAVPTLSEWGTLALSALLAVGAVVALRKKAGSKAVLSLTLAVAATLGMGTGAKLVGNAWAVPGGFFNPQGGTVHLTQYNGVITLQNTTQVPLQVKSISFQPAADAAATTCDPGVVVAPGASCAVDTGAPT